MDNLAKIRDNFAGGLATRNAASPNPLPLAQTRNLPSRIGSDRGPDSQRSPSQSDSKLTERLLLRGYGLDPDDFEGERIRRRNG